jgi:hypothetical protein
VTGRYAVKTDVSSYQSQQEIEKMLRRYGADAFQYGWDNNKAAVGFRTQDRHVRFVVPLPDKTDDEFTRTPARKQKRTPAETEKAWEQACRQRWRALALAVKAKLEAVEVGIATFDDEFAAYIVLPNGRTVGEWLTPQIEEAYETGVMPELMPGLDRQIEVSSRG